MRQPNPLQYALATVTAYDGDTNDVLDRLLAMDSNDTKVDDRYVVTGLIGVVHELADRLANRAGTTRAQILQHIALDLAERIERTGA